ncbi:aspartate aminotransferase family protein [soil metagenome]
MMAGPTTYFDPATTGTLDPNTRGLVERRARVMGSAYRLFYQDPVQLVRGSGTKVYDVKGVEYLDAYNNVPSVGHAHPRVVAAMTKQAALLATHTRYLSEPIIAYAEDLLATLPEHIANVMFTCTGSEANDLALKIAKLATGGTGVIVTGNAYHGVTTEVAAISPSLGGRDSLGSWVRTVEVSDLAAGVERALADFAAAGIRPAALIVDTIFASDGVYPDAQGLAQAVATIRKAGGLFIADEVQPGFGRLGTGMWGFDRHGLQPDIVTLGKPMGNGQPVAAMLARRELVDEFNRHSRYFNTFGGSSVSIAAAQATLDVLREENLIENARVVGSYLLDALRDSGRFTEVRGSGLFIGAQLESEKRAVDAVNALRERRVLLAASGPDNDTLKIRPPLPFSIADADRLLAELDAVVS